MGAKGQSRDCEARSHGLDSIKEEDVITNSRNTLMSLIRLRSVK